MMLGSEVTVNKKTTEKKEPNWMIKLALQNEAFVSMMKPLNPLEDKYHITAVNTQNKEFEGLTQEDMEKMVEWAKNQKKNQ